MVECLPTSAGKASTRDAAGTRAPEGGRMDGCASLFCSVLFPDSGFGLEASVLAIIFHYLVISGGETPGTMCKESPSMPSHLSGIIFPL